MDKARENGRIQVVIGIEVHKQLSAKTRNSNIGVVIFPLSDAGETTLLNLVDIVNSLSSHIYLVTGYVEGFSFGSISKRDSISISAVGHIEGANHFTRVINYVWTQVRICYRLIKVAKNADIWIFFLGGENLLLPMITAKFLGRRVILLLGGFSAKIGKIRRDPLSAPLKWIFKINCALSNRIVVYSAGLIAEHNLEKHKYKISIAQAKFLDFDKFKVQTPLSARSSLVGYIGRLSQEKGIQDFLEAIPKILEVREDSRFLIGGDGQLRAKVEAYLHQANLNSKVNFVGWIPHSELPKYLNELKLLVVPSYTETFPTIIVEAMACGTAVLATPVGSIPDILKDGEVGFITEDNSPMCIAKNVVRALNHPDLAEITKNGRMFVEKEFNYKATLAKFSRILEQTLS